jgi:transcription elongation factor Elf1
LAKKKEKMKEKFLISLLQRKKINRQDHFVCLLCSEAAAAAAAASGRYLALHVVKQKSVRETVSAKRCNFIFFTSNKKILTDRHAHKPF